MKKILTGAVTVGVLFAVSGCASGLVVDKRAPGVPGNKTYQIQVDKDERLVGPDEVWVTVPENEWDECSMYDTYPGCAG